MATEWTNERIDDIVDNHIFLDNGTSTYRVWEDRANKYMRQMRDDYQRELADLRAQLARAQEVWQPAHDTERVINFPEPFGHVYLLRYPEPEPGEEYIVLPDSYAVCRRTKAAEVNDAS